MMRKVTRRHFLGSGVGLAGAAVLQRHAAAQQKPDKPNILMIVVDDLGYGDLSSYGGEDLRTPHLDALLDSGCRFTQFYANCPVCSPTRAAILTGQFPDRAGVPGVVRTHRDNNWGCLSTEARLLPQELGAAGYDTAIVGKWHLGLESPNTPRERGFGFFHGFLGDMMDDYYTHLRHEQNYMRLDEEAITPQGHATDLFTDWAVDYLEGRQDQQAPFFLYLAYNAPHDPIQPPENWLRKVQQRAPEMDEKRAKLVALIEHMDAGIGKVLKALDTGGLAEDTLVLFTSDNGGHTGMGANNGALRGMKGEMYEGGIRVPAGAAWPGRIPEGSTSDAPLMTTDLYPTACAAAGVGPEKAVDGHDLLPLLTGAGGAPPEDRLMLWVRREGGGRYRGQEWYAVRRGPWKLLQPDPFSPYELYKLDEDPLEEHPLPADHPQYKQLAAVLQDHVNDVGAVPWQREKE